jgi:hypothetical protein
MIETIEEVNELFLKYITENMMYTNFEEYETHRCIKTKGDCIYNYINTIDMNELIEMFWHDTIEINNSVITDIKCKISGNERNNLKWLIVKYFEWYRPELIDIFVEYIDDVLSHKTFLK